MWFLVASLSSIQIVIIISPLLVYVTNSIKSTNNYVISKSTSEVGNQGLFNYKYGCVYAYAYACVSVNACACANVNACACVCDYAYVCACVCDVVVMWLWLTIIINRNYNFFSICTYLVWILVVMVDDEVGASKS